MSVELYELPDGWRWEKLQRLVQMKKGKKPSQFDESPTAESLPYIDIEAFEKGIIKRYANANFGVPSDENDVLIVWDGARAGLAGKGMRGLLGSTIAGLSPLDINKDFLRFFLHFNYDEINSNTRGTGIPHINPEIFWSLEVPLPPPAEQHRIINKIESLFAEARTARAALAHAEPLLKKFRQAVLSAAFRGALTERDANDEPASVLLEGIRNERRAKWENDLHAKGKDATKAKFVEAEPPNTRELGELPEGWEWATVEQIAEVRLGRQRSPSRAKGPNMRPYLRSANVRWDGLDLSDVKEMDFTPQEQETYRLKRGDIVLVEGSGSISEVGKPAIWNDEIENCCMQNTLIRVRTDAPLPEYLHLHFQYDALGARFRHATKGIGINHLGAQGLSKWVIALPPLAEQQRIVKCIESLFVQAEQIERAVEIARRRAEKVEQAILARAFRGEL